MASDKELDSIYDAAGELLKCKGWSTIDDLLQYYGLSAWRQDIDILLAWATMTRYYKEHLKNRKWFMEQCLMFHSDPNEPLLWDGLV